jgi:hypothetical protein
MHDAGVVLAIRYLTGEGKAIDRAELLTLIGHGIDVAFVFEVTANDSTGGFGAGVANAFAANAALAALGFADPGSVVIYFAIDTEILDPALVDVVPYFKGINSVRSVATTGVYGEGDLLAAMAYVGQATFFWQSESTGFPGSATAQPCANLLQRFDVSPIAGTDLDYILKSDVGQEPRPVPPTPTPPIPPPPPTPTTCNPTLRILRPGMSGPDVRHARLLLNDHGATPQLPTGNAYDSAMGVAVVAFKKAAKMNNSSNGIGGACWMVLLDANDQG